MSELRECIMCGQLTVDDVLDDFSSTRCERCAKEEEQEAEWQHREYERSVMG